MYEARVSFSGRLTKDPETRFLGEGKSVTNMRVAHRNKRKGAEGVMEDGETIWFEVRKWGTAGEAVADDMQKGDIVVVTGTMFQKSYTSQAGEPRTSLVVDADEVGFVPRADRKQPEQAVEDDNPWA